MLKPSYAELMDVLNKNSNEQDEVTSRYTIVIAAAKRARQIIEGDEPMVKNRPGKPVSTAVDEILNNKIKIVPEGEGTVLVFEKDKKKEKDDNGIDLDDIEIDTLEKETSISDKE
nr:DNA-directed RNA polymerase subunit omega [uncultured Tyzzerella sp.]